MVMSLTISDQYVLIEGDASKPWELWQLNANNSVRIQLPEFEMENYCIYWLLDPSSTPRYLVCIINSEVVLVFDQLNDPQFLRRLVLPVEGNYIMTPRLLTTKGVEQTALVITQRDPVDIYKDRVYISDLMNDFTEIIGCNIHKYTNIDIHIGVHGEMYRTEFGDSYYLYLYFGGKRFLFNESKVQKINPTHFKREEIASCCLPYHMVGRNSEFRQYPYCQVINATDTRLLWLIESPRKCENRNCPIREGFHLLVEQDFLMNSREGNE